VGTGTALYEALARYVVGTTARDGQHVLVLYSDGGDSRSRISLGEIVHVLRQGDLILYAVGYLDNQRGSGRLTQQSVLERLARETGGEAFFPTSSQDVARISARIAAEIQGRYTLGYQSSSAGSDGRFRRVEVRLSRPDLRDATVRTRSGYIATPSR
jgi:Ca-activated chloride channel family protein